MQYYKTFLVLQSSHLERNSRLLYFSYLLDSCGCYRSLPLSHGAVVWSAVYDCGISLSYSHFDRNWLMTFFYI